MSRFVDSLCSVCKGKCDGTLTIGQIRGSSLCWYCFDQWSLFLRSHQDYLSLSPKRIEKIFYNWLKRSILEREVSWFMHKHYSMKKSCSICGNKCDGSLYFEKKQKEPFCRSCWQNWQKHLFGLNPHPGKLSSKKVKEIFYAWLSHKKSEVALIKELKKKADYWSLPFVF